MKPPELKVDADRNSVVPYIGTWIETVWKESCVKTRYVVPYIGTWIETEAKFDVDGHVLSYLI